MAAAAAQGAGVENRRQRTPVIIHAIYVPPRPGRGSGGPEGKPKGRGAKRGSTKSGRALVGAVGRFSPAGRGRSASATASRTGRLGTALGGGRVSTAVGAWWAAPCAATPD